MVNALLVKNLWVCLPPNFFTFINTDENFQKLNQLNVKFEKCNLIVTEWLDDQTNLEKMRKYLKEITSNVLCEAISKFLFEKYKKRYAFYMN